MGARGCAQARGNGPRQIPGEEGARSRGGDHCRRRGEGSRAQAAPSGPPDGVGAVGGGRRDQRGARAVRAHRAQGRARARAAHSGAFDAGGAARGAARDRSTVRPQVLLDEGPRQDAQAQGAARGPAALLRLDLRPRPARLRRSELPVRLLKLARRAQGGGGRARLRASEGRGGRAAAGATLRAPHGHQEGGHVHVVRGGQQAADDRRARPAFTRGRAGWGQEDRGAQAAGGSRQGQDGGSRRPHLAHQQGVPPPQV